MTEYVFMWGNNEKRKNLKGRRCYVMAQGKKNSILIEFADNSQKEIVSRNSIRIAPPIEPPIAPPQLGMF
jgi:hypothetical protein